MFFWNLSKLKSEIIQNKLGEAEIFKYFLAYMIINVLAFEIKMPGKLYSSILNLIITIFGTIYCYHCNGASKGIFFLERYFVIGWVVIIRYIFLVCLPLIVTSLLLLQTYDFLMIKFPEVDVLLAALLAAGFYWRLGVNIQSVSKISKLSS